MEQILDSRISKDFINTLPLLKFDGEIVVIKDKKSGNRAIEELKQFKIVGFDTESRPAFRAGISYPVSILQLATENKAFLFQLRTARFTDNIAEFLSDEKILKVGIGLKDDLEKLNQLKKFKPRGFVDLSTIAAKKGIVQPGVRALAARYLGVRISKTAQRTNWANPELNSKQKKYAATDAWICLKMHSLIIADKNDYRVKENAELE